MKQSYRFIFFIGGVMSGLGKGISTASLGLLLKSYGFRVTAIKIDPYISIDAGTMKPAEHGEVFVTADGGEIDQDLGNYERFLGQDLSKNHNITTGKIFRSVIDKERHFYYKGRDAEMIPDIIDEIKKQILKPLKNEDFVLVEIGGTTGDLENMPFLHAARELGRVYPCCYVMVTYLPLLKNTGELKTKPTQHAVARLRETGIFPDFLITRSEIPIDKPRIETLSKRCFIDKDNIIDNPDTDVIYDIPLRFAKLKFPEKVIKKFGLERPSQPKLGKWRFFVKRVKNPEKIVRLGLVGKYVFSGTQKHRDVYISVLEAVRHACAVFKVKAQVESISSEELEKYKPEEVRKLLISKNLAGIIVPQGWGSRGAEGKILAAQFARENDMPYLGLCFGMQMAVIEFARNVCKLKNANSREINPSTPYPVIDIMPEQKQFLAEKRYGGTIRLGNWVCRLRKDSRAYRLYKKYGDSELSHNIIVERHRHRYEFNNKFRRVFEKQGMVFSGVNPRRNLVEVIELRDHPFFIGTQFHPEYKSRPLHPHPLFLGFIEAVLNYQKSRHKI